MKLNYFVEITDEMLVELQNIIGSLTQQISKNTSDIADLQGAGAQLVQHVQNLTAGLMGAAAQYDDGQAFAEFGKQYGPAIGDLEGRLKTLNGEDYSFTRDLYDNRPTEGVDGFVEGRIAAVKDALLKALDGLKSVQETVEAAGEAAQVPEESGLSQEELAGSTGDIRVSPEVEALLQ